MVGIGDASRALRELPTGTVTFLFTDIEGSTNLLRVLGADTYGRIDDASSLFRDALNMSGSGWRLAILCLVGLGAVASRQGRYRRSARLLGAVAHLCEETSLALERQEAEVEAHVRQVAQDELGKEAFETAHTEGESMTLEEAAAYAAAT